MIIDNTEIVRIVTDIESEYNKSTTTTHYAILYSKLAVIEFCGWIEQVFDSINNLENLEDYLENYSGFLLQFKSILGSFTTTRNIAAHTYTPYAGATVTYQSPSVVLSNIRLITPILQKIENLIMRY